MALFVGSIPTAHFKTVPRPPAFGISDGVEEPVIVPGDWDLAATPVTVRREADRPRRVPASASDPFPVAIGRDGDIVSLVPVEAAQLTNGEAASVHVRVVGRHPSWEAFRRELLALAQELNNGLAYAPLTHIDLRQIPSFHGPERFEAIARNISPAHETILDIGANLGYMCEELEKLGKRCVAVEWDPKLYRILTKLKRANSCGFETVNEDVCSYVQRRSEFHTVLALAVFHHFIKTEAGHARLIDLLQRLVMKEMFFWAHNPIEAEMGHMRNSFRNYQPEEFAQFIVDHSCLQRFGAIGQFKDRVLYHLTA